MRIYEVRISRDALQDMARLRTFLLEMMSEDGAVRYANNMRAEIKMLSVFTERLVPRHSYRFIPKLGIWCLITGVGIMYFTLRTDLWLWIGLFLRG